MSIIVTHGHNEIAEAERMNNHPDVFSSCVAARLVTLMANEAQTHGIIEKMRADLNVQSLAKPYVYGKPTDILINIGGQVTLPEGVHIQDVASQAVRDLLATSGYTETGDFPIDGARISTEGVTQQSPHLQATSTDGKFADSCVVYGHYLAEPYGIQGTFPSLMFAKQIDDEISTFALSNKAVLPDGKIHVHTYNENGKARIKSVYISVSHKGSYTDAWNEGLKRHLLHIFKKSGLSNTNLHVNAGGSFNHYFLQADAGVSKAKDDVVITGGIHHIGTDRVWGKCLYKASSIALPYSFALSRAVAEVIGAAYASVGVYVLYGQKNGLVFLQDIDPLFESKRDLINSSLARIPSDPESMRSILSMPVSLETYKLWNQPGHFHDIDRPWKQSLPELQQLLKKNLHS